MADFGTTADPSVLVELASGVVAGSNVPDRPAAGTVLNVRDYQTGADLPDVTLDTGGHWTASFDSLAVQVSFDSRTTWSEPVYGSTLRSALVGVVQAYLDGLIGAGVSLDAFNALAARVSILEAGGGGGGGSVTPAGLASVIAGSGLVDVSVLAGDGSSPDQLVVSVVSPGLESTPTLHVCGSGLVARPATTRPVQWVVRAVDVASLGSSGTTAGGTNAYVDGLDLVDVIQ